MLRLYESLLQYVICNIWKTLKNNCSGDRTTRQESAKLDLVRLLGFFFVKLHQSNWGQEAKVHQGLNSISSQGIKLPLVHLCLRYINVYRNNIKHMKHMIFINKQYTIDLSLYAIFNIATFLCCDAVSWIHHAMKWGNTGWIQARSWPNPDRCQECIVGYLLNYCSTYLDLRFIREKVWGVVWFYGDLAGTGQVI